MRTGERSLYPRLRCRLSPTAVGRSPTADAGDLRNVTGRSPSITLLSIASDQRLPSSRLVVGGKVPFLRTLG